jgi:CHAT domain-containing protein
MADTFCLDWFAGPSAQIELFSPGQDKETYQLKYTPSFRATIRPPVEERPLSPGDLGPINAQLDQLVTGRGARFGGKAVASKGTPRPSIDDVVMLGQQLLALAMPQYVQADLRIGNMFLEIGTDEQLLDYPWELMHDGENFLCLKHAIGRFVNSVAPPPMAWQPPPRVARLQELSILLVSVPAPQERDGQTYTPLPEATVETDAILEGLVGIPGVKVSTLIGRGATYNELFKALSTNTYQIIHFNGHAHFNQKRPRESGLVLHDRDVKTGAVVQYFGRKAPILCFVNACETTKVGTWNDSYDIFGLARAFLETGAYLLGSRWRIGDRAAAGFATAFYKSLISDGHAVGTAILDARGVCKDLSGDDFGWASYTYYGDPRMCFKRIAGT